MVTELDTSVPFTRATGIAAGLTPRQLRGPRFRKIFRNVYVDASRPSTPRQRVLAALALFDELAWASHASAARLHEMPIPTIADEHVSVPQAKHRRHHAGIRTHVGQPWHAGEVHGIRTSTALQTFVELSEILGLVDLVVVGDHLVRRTALTPAALVAFCRDSRHRSASRARDAAAYVRAEVDSPMETRLRMLMVLAGLPEPRVNLVLRTSDGEVRRKYDLSYPDHKIAIEYDGRLHVERIDQWESDLARRESIDDTEWRILVVVSSGIFTSPGDTLERIHRLLLARGVGDVPARLGHGWRAHFPGYGEASRGTHVRHPARVREVVARGSSQRPLLGHVSRLSDR